MDDYTSERLPKTAVFYAIIMQERDMCRGGRVPLSPDPTLGESRGGGRARHKCWPGRCRLRLPPSGGRSHDMRVASRGELETGTERSAQTRDENYLQKDHSGHWGCRNAATAAGWGMVHSCFGVIGVIYTVQTHIVHSCM